MRKQPMPNRPQFQGRPSIAPNILPGVTYEHLTDIVCKECQGTDFHPVHKLKVASRFQSVNGMPTMVQIPLGFACDNCGAVNPFDQSKLDGTIEKKTEETGGDLGINVAEDVTTKDKPSG